MLLLQANGEGVRSFLALELLYNVTAPVDCTLLSSYVSFIFLTSQLALAAFHQ